MASSLTIMSWASTRKADSESSNQSVHLYTGHPSHRTAQDWLQVGAAPNQAHWSKIIPVVTIRAHGPKLPSPTHVPPHPLRPEAPRATLCPPAPSPAICSCVSSAGGAVGVRPRWPRQRRRAIAAGYGYGAGSAGANVAQLHAEQRVACLIIHSWKLLIHRKAQALARNVRGMN